MKKVLVMVAAGIMIGAIAASYARLPAAPAKTDAEKAAEAERDKAYKETLKKIPDAKSSNDPWGGMRSDPPKQAAAPKASAATSAPKKTKAGTAAN